MGWKHLCFGSDHPSFLRVVVVSTFMIGLGLCLYGLIAHFIPSDAWSSIGFYMCVGLATFTALWVYWGHLTGRLARRPQPTWVRVSSFIALPFMLFGYFYLSLVYALSDIGTHWLGAESVRTENVTTHFRERSGGRSIGRYLNGKFCRYYIKGPGLDHAFLFRICSASYIPGNSDSTSALDLTGRRSWFGFHVSDISRHAAEISDPAPSPAANRQMEARPAPEKAGPMHSAVAEHPGTIETERIDSNSYRMHLTGVVFNSAEAGRALLRPKATDLCGGQSYRFGDSHFTYRVATAQDPYAPGVELTQEVHCGGTKSAAGSESI